MANFYSNTQSNPASSALNKAKDTNPYDGLKPKDPNVLYTTKGTAVASAFPKKATIVQNSTPNSNVKSPFTGSSTGGLIGTQNNSGQVNAPQFSPQSYASQQQGLIDKMGQLSSTYAPRVAAPYNQFGIGEGQKRLSDYELARYNTLQTGLSNQSTATQGLLEKSLPQAISAGSSVINPIAGTQLAGYSPEQSAFRGGQISQIGAQGGQSVQINQAQNTISGVKALLGNDNSTAITKLNGFVNDIRNNVSSPERAQFESTLGSLAAQVAPFNPTLASSLTGEALRNSSGVAILSAINQAQQAIQAQQQAISGGVNSGTSGSTGGSFEEQW